MKKKFGIYAVIWAVALVVFNVVSFTIALNTGKELNASFFIGYIVIVRRIAFQAQG